ncbi:MAG: tyrosine-type recombinase/integrase [Rhizomicrobium sp.]|nr:tyrosine-type recombinase/integrase [Rhizomicrobium sp.]
MQSRNGAKKLILHFGGTAKVSSLTEDRLREFAEAGIARGEKLSYIARTLVVLHAALAFCGVDHKVIYTEAQMAKRWRLPKNPPKKARIPTDDEVAKLLSSEMPEDLRRFILIQLATGGRPQTALDLTPEQRAREAMLVDLNPEGRVQTKKFRPNIRVSGTLTALLDEWEAETQGMAIRNGHYCGYTSLAGVRSALRRAIKKAGINHLSQYSFRHKATTVMRRAGVTEDQLAVFIGHKRQDVRTTAGYGEWDPSYLREAAAAIDKWFANMEPRMAVPLFSQGIPKTIRELKNKNRQVLVSTGAGEANRTPDPNLGKVM